MNKRQLKKKYYKSFAVFKSYKSNRKLKREAHVKSIELARKEHRNYWKEWYRGYPNRARCKLLYDNKFC